MSISKIQNLRLRLFSYFVIAYMLIAFTWWSVLLYTKNRDAFLAKAEYQKMVMIAKNQINQHHLEDFYNTKVYQTLEKKYKRQEQMIFGEALFFIAFLILGIWFINRGYNKEIKANEQGRNFLLSITHELKSPIASIRLILETFLKRDLKREQIQKFSKSGLKETERLHTLVNDLLLSAKLETSYQLFPEAVQLDKLLIEIIQQLQEKYPTTTFHHQIAKDIPSIQADKAGMTSVMLNLLENAVKYSPKESKIDVILGRTTESISLAVADQGFGIPDREKKRVFDKFYRVGNEDTRQTTGTGLGLYIVRELVKAHNGKITLKNNQPKGSIFKIELKIP